LLKLPITYLPITIFPAFKSPSANPGATYSGLSYYAAAASLQPAFYQSLLDRGWRRSGDILYKPNQRASCCPQYTIRLDATAFHASKDQRQAVNRFNRHLRGDAYLHDAARLYPQSRGQARHRDTDFDLCDRIHDAERARIPSPPEPAHAFTVTLEPSGFTDEKFALYENYQRVVHHDPPASITKRGFTHFLCASPLTPSTETVDGRVRRLGSYHQCYRLDGKLVAVGVLDLLPQCVSAVYFMYHESVHQHNFGKLGALREIALSEEDGYRWWYAGFYIHSCTKMRYKGDYSPQYMLDPESYAWNPLDADLKKRLDENQFLDLSREPAKQAFTESDDVDMDVDADIDMDEDADDDPPLPDPDVPLFARSMPGVLTRDQLRADIDLDHIRLRVRGREAEACHLVGWEDSSMDDPSSIKCMIAELVAAVGVGPAREMAVKFG
jgi:arginine-tRNA-protein transferase